MTEWLSYLYPKTHNLHELYNDVLYFTTLTDTLLEPRIQPLQHAVKSYTVLPFYGEALGV